VNWQLSLAGGDGSNTGTNRLIPIFSKKPNRETGRL